MAKDVNTHKNILVSAERIFAQKGYNGAGVQQIAEDAKVNKAMIFYYFKSKENLYLSIILEAQKEMSERVEEVSKLDIAPVDKIKELAKVFTDMFFNKTNLFKILLKEMGGFRDGPSLMNSEYIKKINGSMEDIIKQGIEAGEFRNIDPGMAVMSFIGIIKTLFAQQFFTGKKLSKEDIINFSFDLILNGIKAEV
ncbi:MAG: TetR/AcrR family transcriptional regulator [Armatimonadota bacterium]